MVDRCYHAVKANFLKAFDMELLKFEIPMSKLSSISKGEKAFFVQICNFLNDLSILQKLTLFSTSKKATNAIERTAQNIQTLSLLRIQAGKLHEGWKILHRNFFKKGFSQKYLDKLTPSEKHSYDKVRIYFDDKKNLISWIRNNFAFHYFTEPRTIKKLFDKVSDSEIFEIFVSEFYGNCVFSMSNTLLTFAILKYTGITDTEKAMGKLLGDVTRITSWFGHFLGRFLVVFAEKHLGLKSTPVEIPEPPDINEVTLPYFIKGEQKDKRAKDEQKD